MNVNTMMPRLRIPASRPTIASCSKISVVVVKIFSWCASNIFLFTDGVEDLPREQQHVEAEADPADDQRVDRDHEEHSHQDLEPEPGTKSLQVKDDAAENVSEVLLYCS